ncbi:MAG TPA: RDD family protein [Dermatophilaceae bacterium]|nr:RDD family protein [Dermatophilaceae bacterium]
MTEQAAGWYDDPDDPSQLRYWDGVMWTRHVVPRTSPTLGASTIGMADDPAGRGRPASPPPQPSFPPPAWTRPGSPAGGESSQPGGYSPYPAAPPAQQPGQQWERLHIGRPLPTTLDGVPLAGWWQRVLARVLDWFVVLLASLPLTWGSYQAASSSLARYVEEVVRAAEAGGSTAPVVPDLLVSSLGRATLLTAVVYAVYEIGLITAVGATVGKRVVGISVRPVERPGPPPLAQAVLRWLVKDLSRLASVVSSLSPLLSVFSLLGSVFGLVDSLWPLWDPRRQALHDKAARTQVVKGSQRRRPS